ncbi:S9 family peptidase [Pelagibacterium lacus]|uniref:S9 family peptidase n=1 Tax=Pelagibacterium lacus TaxID=2282655 RepID=A0A369W8W7_9HYPH|nr:S9 family peptidase [Pelagibacterium lacus]RDE10507.1 S9 family peptidase [Pelagibacterium lacus]
MSRITPPLAPRHPISETRHGTPRTDPYSWLRAENWRDVMADPTVLPAEIRAYLEAENAWYAEDFGNPTKTLQEQIYAEIKGRIKEDDSSVPSADGLFAYFSRTREGDQYPLVMRTERDGGAEEILLDCNAEAGEGYFGFGGAEHSPSHTLLAWAADRNGSEHYTISIRDLASGIDRDEKIEKAGSGAVWANDSASFYYIELDDNHRPFRVRRHVLGTRQDMDEIVYEEKDPGFFVGVGQTQSKRFITISAHDHQTSEVWLIDANKGGSPICVEPRHENTEYSVEERHGALFILTNDDGAEDFKIVQTSSSAPGQANWVDLVPHEAGRLILDMEVLANHLIRLERKDGLPRIVAHDLRSGAEEVIAFPEEAYALGLVGGYEFDTATIRFTYSSPTTPSQVFDLELDTGARTLRKEQEVPSGHDPARYETRRLFATASDGETVPVTVLYRKDTQRDGTAPCLLYGYGAYGHSIPAGFSISVLSLVDRGFVYAIAHVRGGMDKGYRWYKAGRAAQKSNTFTDFIAAAEMLIAENYTARGRIVAEGGSAGGLLMGAIANMRPDLWGGVIAVVPFVDVLNTMLDDTLPLTPPEWPEWGNPILSKEDYERIASYSPYDNIAAVPYPPMLVLAGLTDPRVTYWEPAKWVARLRATKTDDNALYLRTNMEAGHGGASGRFERIKETAITYAFALRCAGLA